MCSDAVSHFHFIAQEIQTNSKNYSTKVLRDDVSWQLFRFSGFLTEQLFLVQGPSSCCFLRLPLSCLPIKQHYAVNSLQEVPNSHTITLHSVGCSYEFTYDLLKIRTQLKLPLIFTLHHFKSYDSWTLVLTLFSCPHVCTYTLTQTYRVIKATRLKFQLIDWMIIKPFANTRTWLCVYDQCVRFEKNVVGFYWNGY